MFADIVIRRSCENIKISDCQKANDVLYCYCFTNYCNGEDIITVKSDNTIPSDDEDILEGSGYTRKTNQKEIEVPTIEHTKSTSVGNMLHCGSLILLIAIVLVH